MSNRKRKRYQVLGSLPPEAGEFVRALIEGYKHGGSPIMVLFGNPANGDVSLFLAGEMNTPRGRAEIASMCARCLSDEARCSPVPGGAPGPKGGVA